MNLGTLGNRGILLVFLVGDDVSGGRDNDVLCVLLKDNVSGTLGLPTNTPD